jgi:hypothetical protein
MSAHLPFQGGPTHRARRSLRAGDAAGMVLGGLHCCGRKNPACCGQAIAHCIGNACRRFFWHSVIVHIASAVPFSRQSRPLSMRGPQMAGDACWAGFSQCIGNACRRVVWHSVIASAVPFSRQSHPLSMRGPQMAGDAPAGRVFRNA